MLSSGVAAELRAHLARRRLSQAWLAAQMGLSQSALSKKLSGRHPFAIDELAAATAALGVTIQSLFDAIPPEYVEGAAS